MMPVKAHYQEVQWRTDEGDGCSPCSKRFLPQGHCSCFVFLVHNSEVENGHTECSSSQREGHELIDESESAKEKRQYDKCRVAQ